VKGWAAGPGAPPTRAPLARRPLTPCVAALLALAGCHPRAERPHREDRVVPTELRGFERARLPQDLTSELHLSFAGKLELRGFRLEPAHEVKRGEVLRLALYWRALAPLEGEWQLVTELFDERGRPLSESDVQATGPLRKRHAGRQPLGPSAWEAGNLYEDPQELRVPADTEAEWVTLTTSVVQTVRLRARGAGSGSGPEDEAQTEVRHALPILNGPEFRPGRARVTVLAPLR
jgi:hypothetical protein